MATWFACIRRAQHVELTELSLQTELERERIALELVEEKKAQAEREKMVQEQAKKIETLSSMVLYSNRDENRDRFKKVCLSILFSNLYFVLGWFITRK